MNILGLHITGSQASAALLKDGEIICGAAEERFNRVKQSRDFPRQAIRYCLAKAGLTSIHELDGVAVSWNPAINMSKINLSGFTQWRRYDPEWLYILPNNLMGMGGRPYTGDIVKMEFPGSSQCPLYYVGHHRSHLAHAIAQSPFEHGLALAIDEYGEHASAMVATFDGGELSILKEISYPNSLGVFYAAITEYLGFTANCDEWKVMGAAAYGDSSKFRTVLSELIVWDDKTTDWVLDTRFIEHSNMKRAGYLNERLVAHVGISPRSPQEPLEQCHYDLAASAQAVFEYLLFQLITHYCHQTGETNLAAAGGCFMNSLANGKIIGRTPIQRLFVPYAAADNGGAVGAPLYIWHYHLSKPRTPMQSPPTPYLGPAYSDAEIEETIHRYGLSAQRLDDPARGAADMLANGKLVGWFQGAMEFGERALGNRSILADPRNPAVKEKINAAVKYRETFRPFAPAVLAEYAGDYFEIPKDAKVPYMEQVYPVRYDKQGVIPAVVHADGTGRLQMIEQDANPLFYRLVQEFSNISGVPVVLNTSFNVQGKPIVCSPSDAIRTYYSCGLDILIMGSFMISKRTRSKTDTEGKD